jgi:hypothetical protein
VLDLLLLDLPLPASPYISTVCGRGLSARNFIFISVRRRGQFHVQFGIARGHPGHPYFIPTVRGTLAR